VKILVYSEYWNTKGGGERYLLNTMEALYEAGHEVVACVPYGFDFKGLLAYFNITTPLNCMVAHGRDSAEQYSAFFDLTVVTTNCRYFAYRSHKAIFILQAPHGKTKGWNHRRWMEAYGRDAMFKRLQIEDVVVYSHFVADSIGELYGVRSTVIEPTVGEVRPGTKQKVILSVGRISKSRENHKNYEVLIDTFRQFSQIHPDWEYRIIGSCSDYDYQKKLQHRARGIPVRIYTNLTYQQLCEHYGAAYLFWHGAGYGVNLEKYPEKGEHFGISTVEAMSSECIILVFNGGGSREIAVGRKVPRAGCVWDTPKQLCARSHDVAGLFPHRTGIGQTNAEDATVYSKPEFQSKWKKYIEGIR
jgi:glycosyltransferase involved in cell wall biosynthesis